MCPWELGSTDAAMAPMLVAHSEHLLPASLLQHLPLLLLMPLLVLLTFVWLLRLKRPEDAPPAW
jgi:hypothetical protein